MIVNEHFDLTEILKNCPEGTMLYSTLFGEVQFLEVRNNTTHPIIIRPTESTTESFTSDGRMFQNFNGECTLFPSREQRDWSKFTAPWYKNGKFDPKILQPFDKVLVRDGSFPWRCDIFSYYQRNKRITCHCTSDDYIYDRCIPYNEETKHLVGTTEGAPEFYRYWED